MGLVRPAGGERRDQARIHPKEWTYENIEQQAASFKRMGFSFDWTRRLQSSDPEYYRWTQWLFLKLFEMGLAYRKNAPTNWCPKDQTVLANEQVINGACERCGTLVVRRDLTQWFFKITDFAQRLLDDVETLEEWPERVITLQRNWIGRSEGATVRFRVEETGDEVEVFTTRPDTLWGVTFFVFAPEHPLVSTLAEAGGTSEAARTMVERLQSTPLTNREQAESREGVRLGVHVVNPVNGDRVPVFVAPYVLMEYGTGAVMGVPAHDQRDFEFAREHGLDVRVVIQPPGEERDAASMTEAYDHEGVMVHSGPFDGEPSPASIAKVSGWLGEQGIGEPAVTYRLRDWLISRQRYWGAPIPIIHCEEHGEVAVPLDELPVELPDDVDFQPGGESPLARHDRFVKTTCPIWTRRAPRHGHDGHVRRLGLVLLPLLLARLRGWAVPTRGRRALAGEPVHGRDRARDPPSALRALLHEGALRRRSRAVRRTVPPTDEPGAGDLRRRPRCPSRRATSSSRCRWWNGGGQIRCGSRCCSPARSRRTSTGT